MGTWPIYKKHFLQLILTKKTFHLIKYLPATFIFVLSFQSVLVYAWNGPGLNGTTFSYLWDASLTFYHVYTLNIWVTHFKSYWILNNPFTVDVRQVSGVDMRLLNWTDSWQRLSPGCKPVCPYCIIHWSGDIVNGEISVAGCTRDCNSDSPRCGQWWRVFVGFALATSSFQCKCIYLSIHLFIYTAYICTLCRILAFWLMFFVLHTTINKVYLILSYLI